MNPSNQIEFQSALQTAVKEIPFVPDTVTDQELKIINDNRMALWRTEEFKNSLRKVIKETLKKEKEQVPNKYASRVYKQMYNSNVKDSKKFKKYEKVMLHPDITKADYYFIQEKITMGVTFFGLGYLVLRKNLISSMMKSPSITVPLIGLVPLSSMLTAQYISEYFLNLKINNIGLFQKYDLQNLM